MTSRIVAALSLVGILLLGTGSAEAERLKGKVRIDGSSTVFPITEAVAEEFGAVQPKVRVTVGVSGTGGGFKKFTVGEIDINDASRPIKQKEIDKCAENDVGFIELPVAFDGISVVVNPKNDWCSSLTVAELNQIWNPESTVKTWSDVRPEWPNREIKLYGPGTDSGTFDYFTEAIMGKPQSCRADFTASEDDNVLVHGVSGDIDALGFFGFAYYVENKDKLAVVGIDNGAGPVTPDLEAISTGVYAPLSRPIFIYVTKPSSERPEIKAFIHFYLEMGGALATEVGYVALPVEVYELARNRFDNQVTGSVFTGRETTVGLKLEDLLGVQ
jgi:phosphate transport system substrate-binding protein